jgi:phosphoglycolate phosphatase
MPAANHADGRPGPVTVVCFWDIDGTLLSTGRAGIFALEAAAREVCGGDVSLQDMHTSGLTDAQIAERIIGDGATAEQVAAFLDVYGRELPAALHRRTGGVMPGVRAILEDLADDPDALSLLLTGNVRDGAHAKLRHYGLDDLLVDGAFCEGLGPRDEIARRAWELAGTPDPSRCYVIGDTPHDVSCGQAIGACTIAVATGGHDRAALEACGPTVALDALPDPAEFRALLGLPAAVAGRE